MNSSIMVKNIFLIASLAFLFGACHRHNVEIKGEIKEAEKQKVYLEQLNVDKSFIVDSTQTDRKGRFDFKFSVTEPTFYAIRVGKTESVVLLAEPDKTISLNGALDRLNQNYWVEGSEGSLWLKLLTFQLNQTKNTLDSLEKTYQDLPGEKAYDGQRETLAVEWDSVFNKQISFSRNFILQHAISPASYYALYQKIDNDHFVLSPDTEHQSYRIVASSMKAMYPESQYTKALLAHYDQINKNLQARKMRELIVNAENNLPPIKLPDIEGDSISLHSLRGKYILLDFCVLGTTESENYIRELKKIYQKYHPKGVEIYQVCLDPNKLLWEECVRRYGIKWICVRDAQALHSQVARTWNIQNVPANYIIDKKFDIVGKNLNGQRLEDRLNDILK